MSDGETIIEIPNLGGLDPDAQAIAVREMSALAISKNRWATRAAIPPPSSPSESSTGCSRPTSTSIVCSIVSNFARA